MPQSPARFATVPLDDGTVLVIGGWPRISEEPPFAAVTSVLRYSPSG